MESIAGFTILYVVFVICFLYPPPVFLSLGLTVDNIFAFILKDENHAFIHYHMKRISATYFVHCLLPFGYFALTSYFFPEYAILSGNSIWDVFVALSIIPPGGCASVIYSWHRKHWRGHPIANKLLKFVNTGTSVRHIQREMNREFRSINKVIIKCNPVSKVVVTDNWLIKITPYDVCIANQSEMTLKVTSTKIYRNGTGHSDDAQYLYIDVISSRSYVDIFQIRINSVDFQDLQEKVITPIDMGGIDIVHQSLTERFKEEFKKVVDLNPAVIMNEIPDVCIGCMMTMANVKLNISCGDYTGSRKCTECHCRPLWCIDCMAQWFASKQDQSRPDTWFSSKCSCPMCRCTFCVLDVSAVVISDEVLE